jgi:hypothetical protein
MLSKESFSNTGRGLQSGNVEYGSACGKAVPERMETVGDLVSSLREIGVELRGNVVTIADAVSGPNPASGNANCPAPLASLTDVLRDIKSIFQEALYASSRAKQALGV